MGPETMIVGERIAAEALALVGVPFRLRGRSAETGLDCVGLALLACARAGWAVPEPPAYALRGMDAARVARFLGAAGLAPVDEATAGGVLLVESGPMQVHLMVRAGAGLVHAHAGLGCVVLMPLPSPWPVLGVWRAQTQDCPNNLRSS